MNQIQRIILISDFHLSVHLSGRSHQRDIRFAALVEYLILRSRREKQPCRLVILGDFFDFLSVMRGSAQRGDYSETAALSRLESIISTHPFIFDALSRWVRAGMTIDYLPGNHDPDLVRPVLQKRLRELLLSSDSGGSVNFFPWIYYIPGLLYAEHGHHYHGINSVATLLAPYSDRQPDQIDLPIGAYFDFYLYDQTERLSLAAEALEQPLTCLIKAYQNKPLNLVKTLPLHLKFLVQGGKFLVSIYNPRNKIRRAVYRQELLVTYAQTLNLKAKTVIAIDRLAEATAQGILRRLARQVTQRSLYKEFKQNYLYQAVQSIHAILKSDRCNVPFYVFGHSHDPRFVSLDKGPFSTATYINSGNWIEPYGESGYPYVEITLPDEKALPDAKIHFWR